MPKQKAKAITAELVPLWISLKTSDFSDGNGNRYLGKGVLIGKKLHRLSSDSR